MSYTGLDKPINICHQTLECRQLRKATKWICLHPLCNNFLDMCDSCYVHHVEYHKQNKLSFEADLQNSIIRFDEQKESVEKVLNRVTTELNVFKEKINQEIRKLNEESDEKENQDVVITELTLLKQQLCKEFDDLIDHLKYESHQIKKNKMRTILEEVTTKLVETQEYINMLSQPELTLQAIRDVSLFDLEYQTHIQRSRMEQILDECMKKYFIFQINDFYYLINTTQNFQKYLLQITQNQYYQIICLNLISEEKVIDDDVALKIIFNVKKDLENILLKPGSKKTQKNNIKLQLENRFSIKNWLFYFEPFTKNFHYINLAETTHSFKTIQLDIDFQIQPGNRSILASDNCIYLVGGYDPQNINFENEQQYRYVYKLNIERRSLQKVSCLQTLRHSFGLCQFQNSLYVVGGYNYIEGSLAKCEKIPLQEGYSSPVPINNLQKRSSHLSVASWQNKVLVKFGGILIDQNIPALQDQIGKQIIVSDNFTEYYIPEYDYWVQMQTLNYPSSFLSCIIEVNKQLLIFGGLAVNGQDKKNQTVTTQDIISPTNTLIKMKAYNIENLDIEICKTSCLMDNSYSLSQPLLKESLNSKKKRIYFLGLDNVDYKNPSLKPSLKCFEI